MSPVCTPRSLACCSPSDRSVRRTLFNHRRGNSPRHPTSRVTDAVRHPLAAESGVGTGAPQGGPLASEERALLDAVLKKDRKATAEFVSRYADPVYGYVSQR